MTHDHPPPDTPKILEVLEPFVDFCACQMRFGANDFAHRHDPHRGHGLHDNLVRRDYKISVFKKRIGMMHWDTWPASGTLADWPRPPRPWPVRCAPGVVRSNTSTALLRLSVIRHPSARCPQEPLEHGFLV